MRHATFAHKPGAAIVEAKELDNRLYILFSADVAGHPAGLGMQIMEIGLSFSDQTLTNTDREGKIRKPASMQMPDLASADVEEHHTAAIGLGMNSVPRSNGIANPFRRRPGCAGDCGVHIESLANNNGFSRVGPAIVPWPLRGSLKARGMKVTSLNLFRAVQLLIAALLLCCLALAVPAQAPQYPGGEELTDPVALLQKRLERGEATLRYTADRGYLPSLLEQLGIPVSSQTLVFSKTSLQIDRISTATPRAVYFNDDVYVGWIPNSPMMEIASTDPRYGTIFYTLPQDETAAPSFQRLQEPCTSCHGPVRPEIPSPLLLMMSVDVDPTGEIVNDFFLTTDRSPMDERWGGWYVTGTTEDAKHMGRRVPSNTARYPSSHSDVVALMLLAHQADVHNRIGELGQAARMRSGAELDAFIEPLVRSLLFSDAAPLTSRVRGSSNFATDFSTKGPRDPKGRSLRDFDLEKRLFRYPLSYLIYSEAFDRLPAAAREGVYARLLDVLSGKDLNERYRHLSSTDRAAILEILTATAPDFAKWASAR